MTGIIGYLQSASSIDVLVAISNKEGQPISEYTEGGTNKTILSGEASWRIFL